MRAVCEGVVGGLFNVDRFQFGERVGGEDSVEVEGEILSGGDDSGKGRVKVQVGKVVGIEEVGAGEGVEVREVGDHAGHRGRRDR